MFQMKEKDKTPEKEQNKMKISNLFEKEFNVIVIKILDWREEWMNEHRENFNKDIGNIKQ